MSLDYNELKYSLALLAVPGLGPVISRQLIEKWGSAEAVWKAPKAKLVLSEQIGPKVSRSIHEFSLWDSIDREIDLIAKNDIAWVDFREPTYPSRLSLIRDRPILLFYRGELPLESPKSVAIVGSRRMTSYGSRCCEELVEALSDFGVHIFSGLASGVDTLAHQLALKNGVYTAGVLGHGFKHMYPAANRKLAKTMEDEGGAVLTEFFFEQLPDPENFPRRNRIVAGLADAVIVIESAEKGGSMITARLANEYNREVFSFPGRSIDPISKGCNWLIKTNQAHLCESSEDILNALNWNNSSKRPKQLQLFEQLNDEEKRVVDIILEHQPIEIDQLAQKTGTPSSLLASTLIHLEFKGIITSLPGKQFSV
jgi:DNA processing protein